MSVVTASKNLQALKDAITNNSNIELISSTNDEVTNDIVDSSFLKINEEKYNLNEETNFTEKNFPLRIVYHCWSNKDTSAADYLKECKDKKLQNVSFLIRTDLINWLSGVNDTSKYIGQSSQIQKEALLASGVSETSAPETTTGETQTTEKDKKKLDDHEGEDVEMLDESEENDEDLVDYNSHIGKNERMLTDHNSLLRGTKLVDFNYLVKQSEGLLHKLSKDIAYLKKQEANGKSKSAGIDKNVRKSTQTASTSSSSLAKNNVSNKDPIIMIPSSASSVITMANIQAFLNNGQYISSSDLPEAENDILKISKKFDITKQNDTSNVVVGKNIRFNIVNSTRMFVKPEYWDRVVAIVVNGQEWQFDDYKWSNPEELFKHCNGVFFGIDGEHLPKSIEKWNVEKYYLDKNKTYRNLETCNLFWENVKRECIKKDILKE
ncbi:CDC73-domain-containing protein [Hanseniaspora valbyensis NRRL Y-1626]|uniref:CDC73-domain-containing protein n=1 Tax=Hanseniaspora valbyensis NRRL Y-1626 TaxID=766949 RepID=A0A1B7TJQ4_9ASCO|nr:CDC73-domain-containing protein [Hanseniaspora valbyensis NRRL Y-1626]